MADDTSSSSIVAIVAIIVILGLAFIGWRMFLMTPAAPAGDGTPTVNVDLNTNGGGQ